MEIQAVTFIETPLYFIGYDECGIEQSSFGLRVVATSKRTGANYTLSYPFEAYERDRIVKLVSRIRKAGRINLEYWDEGTPWDYYMVPQTYEEEREEALEREAWGF